jgi:predicted ATPase
LSEDNFIKYAKERADDTTLMVQAVSFTNNLFSLVSRELGRLRVFQLSPHLCRQPGVSTPNAVLSRHGENLPSVVGNLRRSSPIIWNKIEAAMRSILPQLVSIETTFTQDRRLSLIFKTDDSERTWNANEMSDGTIQALALFVALFDARSPVLIVEEPENALHPWILRHFLDLCRSQKTKQILLTTHSPVVINYTQPENLRVMWNRDGESHLAPVMDLNPDIIDLWTSGEIRTFDIYDSGLIHEYLPEDYVPATVDE